MNDDMTKRHEDRFQEWYKNYLIGLKGSTSFIHKQVLTSEDLRNAFLAGCNSMLPKDEDGQRREKG